MTTACFLLQNSLGMTRFFEKTFLLVETSMEIVLRMHFLKLNNGELKFLTEECIWKTYTVTKSVPTAKSVKVIDKDKFAKAALYKNFVTFVIYTFALKALKPIIYLF